MVSRESLVVLGERLVPELLGGLSGEALALVSGGPGLCAPFFVCATTWRLTSEHEVKGARSCSSWVRLGPLERVPRLGPRVSD